MLLVFSLLNEMQFPYHWLTAGVQQQQQRMFAALAQMNLHLIASVSDFINRKLSPRIPSRWLAILHRYDLI